MQGPVPRAAVATRIRVIATLLILALAAGPAGTHLYWMLGGTWGLGGSDTSTGIRVVAAVVVLLIVSAVLVVLARVGLWQQTLVSDGVIRILSWGQHWRRAQDVAVPLEPHPGPSLPAPRPEREIP